MITGFNNDINYRGSVFHVQTEDKGEASAWIESLIYVGGRILARKRATYRQVLEEGGGKKAIANLMERQHRVMIQQIRDGRFDDETVQGAAPAAPDEAAKSEQSIATARMQQQARALFGEEPEEDEAATVIDPRMEPEPITAPTPPPPTPSTPSTPTLDGTAPSLDQVIFDYLSSVAAEESLVMLMDESPALASGSTTRMDLGTHASRSGKPIADARIAVRMISKTGAPVTLAEGATDEDGTLQLIVDVPEVPENSAALIITASSSIGSAEIKHLL